jgi:hypothetical protein
MRLVPVPQRLLSARVPQDSDKAAQRRLITRQIAPDASLPSAASRERNCSSPRAERTLSNGRTLARITAFVLERGYATFSHHRPAR